jgi:hypothetical protein
MHILKSIKTASLHANALCASTAVSSALDLSDYEGLVTLVLDATAQGSGITNAMKVTESDTSGGSYTDVTGGGFTSVTNSVSRQEIQLDTDKMKRFVKLDKTVTGGTGTGYVSVQVIGKKKYA